MIELNNKELAKYIDHTILKPEAGKDDIARLCQEALQYGFASVCVNPVNVAQAKELLAESDIVVACVIGFPLGANLPNVKFYEAGLALLSGAKELDMVLNIAELKGGNLSYLQNEIVDIVELANQSEAIVKVIIETSLLSEEEKINACKVVTYSNAHFIKTSTGFSSAGATIEDIKLMRLNCGSKVKIKASGGIKTREFALQLIEAGADRLGTSAGVKIIEDGNL